MTLRQVGQLVLMSALWGAVFMLIKYALADFSPVEVAFFQAAIGALGLLVIGLVEGGRARAMMVDILGRPLPALVLGALAIAAPFILISTGELSIPSVLAGVLLSSLPMFVAFFAPFIDEVGEERAALGNYLTPIFALFYGVILLGEHLTIDEVIGLALIIVGAEITLRGDSAKRRRQGESPRIQAAPAVPLKPVNAGEA